MTREPFQNLIDRYLADKLTPEERRAFASELENPEQRRLLEAAMEASFMNDEFEGEEFPRRKDRITKQLLEKIQPTTQIQKVHFLRRPWLRLAAACILIFVVTGLFYFRKESSPVIAKSSVNKEIQPGRNGAILTLADGSRIVLDSLKNGRLANQGNAQLVLQSNQLAYQITAAEESSITYNTLDVPRGRQFQVVLPDGTKVWMNAASHLRYPTSFPGNERTIEMSGEAYFEVAHDESKPFIVRKDNTEITVLGTHFNVHAYDDKIRQEVTLLEGSVKVKHNQKEVAIRPGQQARVAEDISILNDVDTDEVVAWKDGKFQFGETADIQSVMRQISRWYDVDVTYEGTVKNHIGGTISRDVTLSQLLKMLQMTSVVKFEVKGNTVVVKPG